jgi:hypothetical protein
MSIQLTRNALPQASSMRQTQVQQANKVQISQLEQQDQVSLSRHQTQTPEKMMEELQSTVEQARKKLTPEERILEAHQAIENLKNQIQRLQTLSPQERQEKLVELNKKLKQQEVLHNSLLQMKKAKGQEKLHLKRPMAQVESELLDRMMRDLGSKNTEIAKSAKETLLLLGIKEPVIDEMEKLLSSSQHSALSFTGHTPKFGMFRNGGSSISAEAKPHHKYDTADIHRELYGTDNWMSIPVETRIKMLQDQMKETAVNNNSMHDVIDAGMNHELNTTVSTGHQVLFGAPSREIIDSNGHVKWISITENLPSGCQELRG